MISFKEDHISQIPALMLLEKMGYTYLTPAEVLELRGNDTANVLLEPILRKQLPKINCIKISSERTAAFSQENIENGIEALRSISMNEGYIMASQIVYQML